MLFISQRAGLSDRDAASANPSHRGLSAIFSGRFDGCSFPTFVHFSATDCKQVLRDNKFIPNHLCDTLRPNATHCKTLKNRLKIRRGQPRGGSTPPPGTTFSFFLWLRDHHSAM